MQAWTPIPCSIYRGGTSKGVFLRGNHLPDDSYVRSQVILSIFGSPDPRQLNGLGGAVPTTSKLAIVERSNRADADVDYTFGQVSIDRPLIDFKPNCGNISSAVGPFAVNQGIVRVEDGNEALVRIFNTNTNALIHARFPVKNGRFYPDGETMISGVPGSAAPVFLDFFEIEGGVTGRLFPTGSVCDKITIHDGRKFTVTVVDAGNLTVLVHADELGIRGNEISDAELQLRGPVLETLEEIRQTVGRILELYADDEPVTASSHALPKIAFIQKPTDYLSSSGSLVSRFDINIMARVLAMGKLHPSYAVTGGIALAVAARIPGTIANQVISVDLNPTPLIRIGHPAGVLEVGANVVQEAEGIWKPHRVTLVRTVRPILDGNVWVPNSVLSYPSVGEVSGM